jgi:hypothetical protein
MTQCNCAQRLAGRVTGDVHLEGCSKFNMHGSPQPSDDVERLIDDLASARYQLGRASVKLEDDPYNETAELDYTNATAAAAAARDALLAHVRGVETPDGEQQE